MQPTTTATAVSPRGGRLPGSSGVGKRRVVVFRIATSAVVAAVVPATLLHRYDGAWGPFGVASALLAAALLSWTRRSSSSREAVA